MPYQKKKLEKLNKFFKGELFAFVVDLSVDKEELWQRIGKKTRNMIRKGEKMGVEVKLAEKEKEFQEWWEIYSELTRIKKFGRQNQNLLRELFQRKNLVRLFVAKKDSKIIGGAFFLIDEYPMYWLGAVDRKYEDLASGHINMWEAILAFKEKGFGILDLGGAVLDKKEGPTRFKKSFNGEMKKGYIYEIPINKFKMYFLKFISKFK